MRIPHSCPARRLPRALCLRWGWRRWAPALRRRRRLHAVERLQPGRSPLRSERPRLHRDGAATGRHRLRRGRHLQRRGLPADGHRHRRRPVHGRCGQRGGRAAGRARREHVPLRSCSAPTAATRRTLRASPRRGWWRSRACRWGPVWWSRSSRDPRRCPPSPRFGERVRRLVRPCGSPGRGEEHAPHPDRAPGHRARAVAGRLVPGGPLPGGLLEPRRWRGALGAGRARGCHRGQHPPVGRLAQRCAALRRSRRGLRSGGPARAGRRTGAVPRRGALGHAPRDVHGGGRRRADCSDCARPHREHADAGGGLGVRRDGGAARRDGPGEDSSGRARWWSPRSRTASSPT